MDFLDAVENKQRIIQEFVPGKQVTIAHIIANPKPELFRKMGLDEKKRGAIGILTIIPVKVPLLLPILRLRLQVLNWALWIAFPVPY